MGHAPSIHGALSHARCECGVEVGVRACAQDRTAFLQRLRDAGVAKVADRQAFANSIGKATRAGWLRAPYKGPFTEAGRELRLAREGGRGP